MSVSRMRNERKICNLALIYDRIAKIPESYSKSSSGNTMVTGSRNIGDSRMRNKNMQFGP